MSALAVLRTGAERLILLLLWLSTILSKRVGVKRSPLHSPAAWLPGKPEYR
jgi:hypothetical protein